MINKRKLGFEKEILASDYLKSVGYDIIDKNFYTRIGEIDIIAKNENYLCFIEVKYRFSKKYGTGLEAIDKKKQIKIMKIAKLYLYKNKISFNTPCRFDCVSIDNDSITLIKNAFP